MIQTDINIELTVEVNGTRVVVEKNWEGPDEEIGGQSGLAEKRLNTADEMLEVCVRQVRQAMGVPTREY